MKMFGLKTVLAAGALALLGSQAGASTLVCPDSDPGYTVDRYLTLNWDNATYDASVSCLFSGYDAGGGNDEYNYFDQPNDGNDWLGHNGWLQIGGDIKNSTSADSLAEVISKTVGSLFDGTSGTVNFIDPGLFGSYAILMKFGDPDQSESWFIFEVDFMTVSNFLFSWSVNDVESIQGFQALSHTSLWGKDPTTTVPLPAGGLLLLTALGGMALVRRRKMVAA
jgi:hypothetical protein